MNTHHLYQPSPQATHNCHPQKVRVSLIPKKDAKPPLHYETLGQPLTLSSTDFQIKNQLFLLGIPATIRTFIHLCTQKGLRGAGSVLRLQTQRLHGRWTRSPTLLIITGQKLEIKGERNADFYYQNANKNILICRFLKG